MPLTRIKPPRELTHERAVARLRRLATDAESSGFILLQHDLRGIADRLEKFECRVSNKPKDFPMKTKTGAQLIAAERQRQMLAEGWTAKHDDKHDNGELRKAAAAYALTAHAGADALIPGCWPWSQRWWKPSADPVRNLVKAGALIAAEIDRLQRDARCPNDTDGDGDCHLCHNKGGCPNG